MPKKLLLILSSLFFIGSINAQITYEPAFPNIDFEFPVEIQTPNDGSNRMFVLEQPGRIKVFANNPDVTTADTFLDIEGQVRYSVGQELGLLGLAFHPDYANNGYLYVYYSADTSAPGTTIKMVLSRFTVDSGNSNLADINSEFVIAEFNKNQNNSNHNGGKIAFGPDGYLYISFGDGGGANDPQGNGQDIDNVFGSICRIDIDLDGNNPVETNPDLPDGNYEIPSDNPLVGQAGLDEIYAYGIRNTWKFSFDFSTNRLWAGDVGQNAYEEINLIENGENYGWSRFEANDVANSGVTIDEETTFPVFFYDRSQGDRSITGGYVYRGSDISTTSPNVNGKYIFGDYVSGRVWALDYDETTGDASSTLLFQTSGQFVSSFGLDQNGELYFSDYGTNAQIYKIDDGIPNTGGTVVNGFGMWESLGQGINGEIKAVETNPNGNIYNAGVFSQAGNVSANNIALWNGTDWSALGSGANASVNALKLLSNGNLVAGGAFTEIGGVTTNGIAVWDGANWSALGNGIDGTVFAIEVGSNDTIYAAGIFETINGTNARNIAVWNGTQWSALTDNTNGLSGTNNEIRSLEIDDEGILYAGGNFDEAGGNSASRIATWNGTNWGTLGDGTSGFVQAITSNGSDIYAGGNFAIAGGMTVNRIARWNKDMANWSTLGNGVNNNVNALLHDGTYLFAGGVFDIANDTNGDYIVKNIARWNDTDGWQAMGTNTQVGVDVAVNAMQFASDQDGFSKIYTGGNFSTAGATNSSNTAVWISENLTSITSTNVDVSCFGEATGSIDLTVTGNTGPYTYQWSTTNGSGLQATEEDQSNLTAGTYVVEVTDTNNTITTYSVTINQPSEDLTCSVLQDSAVTTDGGSDGVATVTPDGGVAPYTYLWDNSETTQTAIALTAGEHTVDVTDANDCVTTCTVTIGEPGTLICNVNQDSGVLCFEDTNGQATATPSGGVEPYEYLWDNSETTQTALALSAGNHTVTITDANGTTTNCSVFIDSPLELTCSIEQEDDSATANPINGTPPYSYLWDTMETTQTVSGLSSGMHSVEVTDANNCVTICEISIDESFRYYPNPTTGIVNFNRLVSWTISNSLGQIVSTGNSSEVDLSSYKSGMYFLRIENGPIVKLIKQ